MTLFFWRKHKNIHNIHLYQLFSRHTSICEVAQTVGAHFSSQQMNLDPGTEAGWGQHFLLPFCTQACSMSQSPTPPTSVSATSPSNLESQAFSNLLMREFILVLPWLLPSVRQRHAATRNKDRAESKKVKEPIRLRKLQKHKRTDFHGEVERWWLWWFLMHWTDKVNQVLFIWCFDLNKTDNICMELIKVD